MSFNLLPKFLSVITDAGERQQNEPGANAVNNCGPAAGSVLMQMLGYGDIEPQDWVDAMPGTNAQGIHGGTTPDELNAFIAGHYHNPPLMEVLYPGNVVAAIDAAGQAGECAIVLMHSDPYGRLITTSGIGHYVLSLGYDGQSVTFWNPDWGVQTVGAAFFRLAYSGLLDLCHRSVLGSSTATAGSEVRVNQEATMTPDDFGALVRVTFVAAQGGEPSPTSLAAYKAAYNGTNAEALITQIIDDPTTSVPYERKRSAVINAGPAPPGPAGPQGPPGPAGPPGPGVGTHEHTVTGTAK